MRNLTHRLFIALAVDSLGVKPKTSRARRPSDPALNPNHEASDTMAQIITLPRTITFTRQFEELPLYSEKTRSGEVFAAGLVDGSIDVSFDPSGDWHISDIHIKVENYRMGKDNLAKTVRIDADENPSLFWHLLDTLTDKYAATIEEWIAFEAAEYGLQIAA